MPRLLHARELTDGTGVHDLAFRLAQAENFFERATRDALAGSLIESHAMPQTAMVYRPAILLAEGRVAPSGELAVSADGRVVSRAALPADAKVVELPNRAIVPGFVNAHSHAFQRLIRGRTEYVAANAKSDDFWAWRDRMYRAAEALNPESLYRAARQSFLEMLMAGVTTVGEFHYLHRAPGGARYGEREAMSRALIRAARDVGIRLVLLRGLYARAGYRQDAHPTQGRFIEDSPEEALQSVGALTGEYATDTLTSFGFAPHSVRALPREWLSAIRDGAGGKPVHMHVSEQPRENEECRKEHGRSPAALLEELGLLQSKFTAVHAIHVEDADVKRLGSAGVSVCACPSTEQNLGDGIVPADSLRRAGASLCLGSDSQASADLLDEARQLEGHLRLLRQRRAVLDPEDGTPQGLSLRLLDVASSGGARALGVSAGKLAPGEWADFVTIDLGHPVLAGADAATFPAAWMLAGHSGLVRDVVVGGKHVVRDGLHLAAEAISRDFALLCTEMFA
ncbi:MAG: formimidoylglutamate deiminase [Myxococcaceae bacterium]